MNYANVPTTFLNLYAGHPWVVDTSLAMSNEAFKCNQHCMSITTIRYRPLIGQVTVASPHFGGRGNSRRLRLGTFVSLHHVYCTPSTASWVRGKEQKRCCWDDINKVSKGHESRKEVFTCSYRENKNFVWRGPIRSVPRRRMLVDESVL